MADKLLRMLLGIFVGAWVARFLGPEQFGELAYVLAFVAFFQAFSLLGLNSLAVRDIATNSTHVGRILGTVLRLRIVAAAVGWIAACVLISVMRPGDSSALLLTAVVAAGILFQTADVVDLWFQSQTQSRRSVGAKAAAFLIANLIKVALIVSGAPLVAFALVQLLDTGVAALFLIWAYRKYPTHGNWHWHTTAAVKLLQQCWPFVISSMAIMIYMRIDQIMLREMVGQHALGIYSAALPFSQAWHFIPVTICASLLPILTRNHAENRALFYARLQKLFTIVAWVAILLVGAVALAANWLVTTLLGAAYEESARVLTIHVFTNIFIFLGVAQSHWIINEGRSRASLIMTTIGAITNVLANLVLIPRYGASGAAFAALMAQAMSAVLCNLVLAPRIFGMQMQAIFPVRYISNLR